MFLAAASLPAYAHGGGGFVMVPVYVPMVLPPAMIGSYQRFHNIAVVSGLGDTLKFNHANFFFNTTSDIDIANWHIDDFVTSTVAQYLSPRFTVQTVTADRTAMSKLRNGPFDNTKADVADILRKIPNTGIDAFVVVRPDWESNTPGQQGLTLNEGGDGIFVEAQPRMGANYEIDVIDARSFVLIAKTYSRARVQNGKFVGFASTVATPSAVPQDKTAPTDAQSATLRDDMQKLLANSLVETLRTLSLGIKLPGDLERKVTAIAAPNDPYIGAKTAAVISLLGDQVTVAQDGQNTLTPVQGWNVDGALQDRARKAMAGRFTIKDVPVDRAAIALATLYDDRDNFAPNFPGLVRSNDVDLYVLIINSPSSVWDGSAGGIGIERRRHDGNDETAVFANYSIVVINAHTLSLITFSQGFGDPDTARSKPLADVDDALWPKTPDGMTAEQAVAIRNAAMSMLEGSVEQTLLHLTLTGMTITTSAQRKLKRQKCPFSVGSFWG